MIDYSYEGYDDLFKKAGLAYYPYVGWKFGEKYPRILFLGESHDYRGLSPEEYAAWNNDHYRTREVVVDDNNRGYQNAAKMIALGSGDYERIWDRIVMYNFLHYHLLPGADKWNIDESLLAYSRGLYHEVLRMMELDLVIAWGVTYLYERWMWEPQSEFTLIDNPSGLLLYRYNSYPYTYVWHIRHPSRFFSVATWASKYREVLDIIGLPQIMV